MRTFSFVLVALFTVFSILSVLFKTLPVLVPGGYLLLSLITFTIYAMDKSAAIKGHWRTPESTLHLFALAGGWPGALIAQQKLRHKSSKQAFRFVFWITVALNLCGFIWLHTSDGNAFLYKYVHNADAKFMSLISDISTPDFIQI